MASAAQKTIGGNLPLGAERLQKLLGTVSVSPIRRLSLDTIHHADSLASPRPLREPLPHGRRERTTKLRVASLFLKQPCLSRPLLSLPVPPPPLTPQHPLLHLLRTGNLSTVAPPLRRVGAETAARETM